MPVNMIALSAVMVMMSSLVMVAVAFAQTASPSPSPTTDGATPVPQEAPATGLGGAR